jgi:hypothetical protein
MRMARRFDYERIGTDGVSKMSTRQVLLALVQIAAFLVLLAAIFAVLIFGTHLDPPDDPPITQPATHQSGLPPLKH